VRLQERLKTIVLDVVVVAVVVSLSSLLVVVLGGLGLCMGKGGATARNASLNNNEKDAYRSQAVFLHIE
jgi:hypothetical protein